MLISAISTPVGTGGIAVIRISGADATSVATRVFVPRYKPWSQCAPGRMLRGTLYYDESRDRVLDDCCCVFYKAPRSYTGEDMVEFYVHGGQYVTRAAYEATLRAGATAAQPGEFTRRAVINGRMDLSTAEGVGDVIAAMTEAQHVAAMTQMSGDVSARINGIRQTLIDMVADILATIDYAEEGLEEYSEAALLVRLRAVEADLQSLIAHADDGIRLREGVRVVLTGAVNAGKSSLMNAMLGEERCIVTDIPGTTRDTVDASLVHGGVLFHLTDTAGIRDTHDRVELLGIERARQAMLRADVVLDCIAADDDPTVIGVFVSKGEGDRNSKRSTFIVRTKCDLRRPTPLNMSGAPIEVYNLSAKTGRGVKELLDTLAERYRYAPTHTELYNRRHIDAVHEALGFVHAAAGTLGLGLHADYAVDDIRYAAARLGGITGADVGADIVDSIFSRFCVGK